MPINFNLTDKVDIPELKKQGEW